jgi:hypothetical protein
MKAKRQVPALRGEQPDDWLQTGVVAIEFRCYGASMRRKITRDGPPVLSQF